MSLFNKLVTVFCFVMLSEALFASQAVNDNKFYLCALDGEGFSCYESGVGSSKSIDLSVGHSDEGFYKNLTGFLLGLSAFVIAVVGVVSIKDAYSSHKRNKEIFDDLEASSRDALRDVKNKIEELMDSAEEELNENMDLTLRAYVIRRELNHVSESTVEDIWVDVSQICAKPRKRFESVYNAIIKKIDDKELVGLAESALDKLKKQHSHN